MPTARAVAGSTFVLAAVLTMAAPAAQTQQQPVFRARTDLVPVYVVAVDEDGNPVMDLTAEDFTLLDRGQAQTISVFDVVTGGPTTVELRFRLPEDLPKDVASNVSEESERLVVVVVDDLHLYRNRTEKAQALTRQLIETLGQGSTMAMLMTSGEGGTPVTDDRALLIQAVAGIEGRKPVPRPARAEDPVQPGLWDPEVSNGMQHAGVDRPLQGFFDNINAYKMLDDAARLLGGPSNRRRVFVLVSEGIGWDTDWLPENTSACFARADAPPCYHDEALLRMVKATRRANIATYVLDPRGFVPGEDLLRECFPSPPGDLRPDPCSDGRPLERGEVRWAQSGLSTLAEVSGGFAITNSDEFDAGIRQIRSDLDNYYLLGFYPAPTDKDEFREIDVAVSRPGLTLRYRQGYQAGRPAEADAPSEDSEARLRELALGMLPSAGLPLKLYAAPMPGTGRTTRVAVVIEVREPRAAIADPDGRASDHLEYSVLAADDRNGKAVVHRSNTADVRSTERWTGASGPDVIFHLTMTLELPPGRYQLRASATSRKLADGGSVHLPLDVPDFAARPVHVGALVIGSTAAPPVPSATAPAPGDAIPFAPSLSREFRSDDTLRVMFDVARRRSEATDARLDVVNYLDQVVLTLSEPLAQGQPGRVFMALPLDQLEPGAYRLRAVASTPAGTDQREIGIVVR